MLARGLWCLAIVTCDLFGSSLFFVLSVLDVVYGCLVIMVVWINSVVGHGVVFIVVLIFD